MGIQPPLARQPDFPTDVLGYAMSAYYGGRTECRVRRISVPVAYCDFLSMYPTINSLLDLWDMVTCERIDVQDATGDVQRFLDRVTLDRCFDPTTWSQLRVLAQVEPDGDVLPTRAEYASNRQWQIGVNPLTSKWPLWYALPDLVAAKLLHRDHKPPRILRALRLVPQGRQSTLRPVELRGEITVDPATTDFFRRVIEERKSLDRRDLETAERERLDEFLKVLANSTSYGIYAEMIRHELADKRTVDVTVQRIDGTSFHTPVRTPEDPGEWFFAPMAALITSAARLMLALAEQSVTDAGGTYAFCDTDSIAIITHPDGGPIHIDDTPDHPIPSLSWEQVDAIRDTFRHLNPYDETAGEESVLELEDENSVDGERTELLCYAISAKRYALYRTDKSGAVLLRRSRNQKYEKWSEHGLGHLSNPTSINTEDRDWIRDAWLAVLAGENKQPAWANQPAVSQTTISSPHLLNPFKDYNTDSRLADQVKAFNFLLSTQVAPLAHPQDVDPARFHLIAPYERDPTQWITLPWRDRYTKRHHSITTTDDDPDPAAVRVVTYADTLRRYRVHPEAKSLDPDGTPCRPATRGLLTRRPVTAVTLTYIGKEANDIEATQAGITPDDDAVLNTYPDPDLDPWKTNWQPLLAQIPAKVIVDEFPKHAGGRTISLSQVKEIRAGRAKPQGRNRSVLIELATRWAAHTDTRPGLGLNQG